MPYLIVGKDDEVRRCSCSTRGCSIVLINGHQSDSLPQYETRQEALDALSPKTHRIEFIASADELSSWVVRERGRFTDVTYIPVPWSAQANPAHYYHFAHLSVKTPGLVAYTKTEEHGIQDRQTMIRPGRYLEQYYPDVDLETRQLWIAQCNGKFQDLQIATSTADIVRIYTAPNGPDSCMAAKNFGDYKGDSHPCAAYGESDLAVAYYGSLDAPQARAVVWPERKAYVRIYGNTRVLEGLLQNAGYDEANDFDAAKIRYIPSGRNRVVVPYIDGDVKRGDRYRDIWIKICSGGDIRLDSTDGTSPLCSAANHCEHCGRIINDDESYCGSCQDSVHTCDHCSEAFWDDAVIGPSYCYCSGCADTLRQECQVEGCKHTWFPADFSRQQQERRQASRISDICVDCAEEWQCCCGCQELFDIRSPQCPECQQTVRCDKSADLPFAAEESPDAVTFVRSDDPRACKQLHGYGSYYCCRLLGHSGSHMSLAEVSKHQGRPGYSTGLAIGDTYQVPLTDFVAWTWAPTSFVLTEELTYVAF